MGIVNVTPDSFSDGGLFLDAGAAVAHAQELAGEGADILDVGGESTRPGAEPVSADEELRRVLPVVEGIAASESSPQISIDTSKASVARAALDAGASLVNDVSAMRADRGHGGAAGRQRGGVLPDAHARRAPHDAEGTPLHRCGGRGEGVPVTSAWTSPFARACARSG